MSESIQALNIAKRAVKISITCILVSIFLSLLNIYILLNQISATAAMSKEIKQLQSQVFKDIKDENAESK